jgi:hypothetical protein
MLPTQKHNGKDMQSAATCVCPASLHLWQQAWGCPCHRRCCQSPSPVRIPAQTHAHLPSAGDCADGRPHPAAVHGCPAAQQRTQHQTLGPIPTPQTSHLETEQRGGCQDPCIQRHTPCAAQATHIPTRCSTAPEPLLEQLHAVGPSPQHTRCTPCSASRLHGRQVHWFCMRGIHCPLHRAAPALHQGPASCCCCCWCNGSTQGTPADMPCKLHTSCSPNTAAHGGCLSATGMAFQVPHISWPSFH